MSCGFSPSHQKQKAQPQKEWLLVMELGNPNADDNLLNELDGLRPNTDDKVPEDESEFSDVVSSKSSFSPNTSPEIVISMSDPSVLFSRGNIRTFDSVLLAINLKSRVTVPITLYVGLLKNFDCVCLTIILPFFSWKSPASFPNRVAIIVNF